jgi:hypothetical protein
MDPELIVDEALNDLTEDLLNPKSDCQSISTGQIRDILRQVYGRGRMDGFQEAKASFRTVTQYERATGCDPLTGKKANRCPHCRAEMEENIEICPRSLVD